MESQNGPLETIIDVDAFFRANGILGTQVVAILDYLLYGAYIVLFGICMSVLVRRKQDIHCQRLSWFFQCATIVILFALATASMILNGLQTFADLRFRLSLVAGEGQELVIDKLITLLRIRSPYIDATFVIANAVADSLLIHRCYIIWGCKKRVVFFPVLLSLGSTAFALYLVSLAVPNPTLAREVIEQAPTNAAKMSAANEFLDIAPILVTVFLAINIFSNVLLTGLIAGRIWWIRHSIEKLSSNVSPNARMYNTAIAIILESGLSYPVALAITFGFQPHYSQLLVCTILNQIVGIAPTLILVRTGLGISVEGMEATIETMRYAPRGRDSENALSVPHSTVVSLRRRSSFESEGLGFEVGANLSASNRPGYELDVKVDKTAKRDVV